MTDDGADEQPVPVAPTGAPVSSPSPIVDAPIAEAVTPEAPAEPLSPPAVVDAPSPEPVEAPVPAEEPSALAAEVVGAPVETAALVEPQPEVVPAALPVVAPGPAKPVRGMPPMLEFASWRLVELVATVAVSIVLFALLLRAEESADAAVLVERLAVTVPLVAMALLVAAIIGLPVGYAAARFGSWLDVGLRGLATSGAAVAPIWLAMLLVLLFSATLQWLQPGGFVPWLQSPVAALTSLSLPALALGLPLAADIALRMRDALRVAQADPAIRTAEAMGLTRVQAIRAHAVRNALADLASRVGVPLALLVPASLMVENVFYLPGLGRLIFTALEARDFATLQLGLTALVALIALCRFLTQLLHAAADPRLARRA